VPTKAFIKDRKRGEVGQRLVADLFRKDGFDVVETPRGFFRGYDLLVSGKGLKFAVEVKTDYRSEETGNICIEVSSLTHSAAGILAIVSGKTIYVSELRKTLELAHKYPIRKMGENDWAESVLIPVPEYISALKPKVLTTNQ
jgi:hypothetical protein